MLFRKSTASSRSQIMTLAMTIYLLLCWTHSTPCVTNHIHPEWTKKHLRKQGPKPSGMITSIVGLAALMEGPTHHTQIQGLLCFGCTGCVMESTSGAAVPSTRCGLCKTEPWSYICGQTSGFDHLLSVAWTVHVGINTDLVIVSVLLF